MEFILANEGANVFPDVNVRWDGVHMFYSQLTHRFHSLWWTSHLSGVYIIDGSDHNITAEVYDVIKGIVHFEIKIWYLSAYPKGIQDLGVFFSSVDPILMFLGQTVLVCQSYNGRYRSLSL